MKHSYLLFILVITEYFKQYLFYKDYFQIIDKFRF